MRALLALPRPTASSLAALLALAVAGCGGGASPEPPSQLPAEGDALILQQVLDGMLAPQEGLLQVSRSGGWPIETSQGFLFAVADGGFGQYALESPSGAFPRTAMKSERGVAWALVPVAAPAGATYRFLSRFGDPVLDGWSRRYGYGGASEHSFVRIEGAHLERWPGVGDGALAPRTVRVWVPAQPPTHFLYAHDGQNLFSPGGWRLDLAAGPSTLVIGIDNTPARMWEYTHVQDLSPPEGGGATDYAGLLELTVRPLIEAPGRYGAPVRRGVLGSSLGGLVSYWIGLRYPASYDFVASLSGTMGWGSIQGGLRNQTMVEAYASLPACPAAALYLDSGGGPGAGCIDADADGVEDDAAGAGDNYCENAQLRRSLEALGCTHTYAWAPGAAHNEAAWRARAGSILDLFEAL